MIGDVLVLLKNLLNGGLLKPEAEEPRVVFINGDNLDAVQFKPEAISVLLVNVEEETTMRSAQPFRRSSPDGPPLQAAPELRLNLYLLFVARFNDYEIGLRYLSTIIRFFQSHRVLNHRSAPALDQQIEKLVVELVTLPFSEQNEIWNALRTAYHPSVLYKVGLVTFQDEGVAVPRVVETERELVPR